MKLFKQAEAPLSTNHGHFRMVAYAPSPDERMPHLALIADGFDPATEVAVRIHSECMTGDVFSSRRCDCGDQLEQSMRIASEEGGVVIYLRQEGRGIGLINKLKAYNLQDLGLNTVDANTHLGFDVDARQYDCAVFMLQDLGIRRVRLITNNPDKVAALRQSPIEVVGRISIEIASNDENRNYLSTKKNVMGHFLSGK
jgi:GTP cyclohydrolase II